MTWHMVEGISLSATHKREKLKSGYTIQLLNDEMIEWLNTQELSDYPYDGKWYYVHDDKLANFYFRDPKIAMLFRLSWA